MTSKEYFKQGEKILSKYGFTFKEPLFKSKVYVGETFLGGLQIVLDPTPKIKTYAIFMRFLDNDKFSLKDFYDLINRGSLNEYSLKWNIHSSDADECLDELEMRLDNLKWLESEENRGLVRKDHK